MTKRIGDVAQLVRAQHCHCWGREFESRHPRHFKKCWYIAAFGALAQLARAPALHAGGQRFDSVMLHHFFNFRKIRFQRSYSFLFNYILCMWLSNKRPRRLNYAVNQKRIKSTSKVNNAVKHYLSLKKRVAFEWETKWLSNAFEIVTKKLRKYWININSI